MGPLLPAVRAIGDIFKPIISGSNLEQDLEDIMAALNETSHNPFETSHNPFFLFGLDDTPPKTAPPAATHSKRHSVVPQRQQLNASKGQHTSSHTSQPKKKGSSIGPLRGLFGQDQGASATPSGPAEGVPPRRTPEREHHAGQSDEEEEESLWRQWNNEDLELL
ncbi:hypothetical protein, conserved [Eimeria praecox]|uniref:Uncharacterized protein n=1 Tax=Eimeria praecox TaxID=51316 RepID=U6H3S9_9EIME|nr:hypothetical protein, conserved [Eimeria praecox]